MKIISNPDLSPKNITKLLLKTGGFKLETYLLVEEDYPNHGELYYSIMHFMDLPESMSYKSPVYYRLASSPLRVVLIIAESCAVEWKGKVFIESEIIA